MDADSTQKEGGKMKDKTMVGLSFAACALPLIVAVWWACYQVKDPVIEQTMRELAQCKADRQELIRICQRQQSTNAVLIAELKRMKR